MLKILFNLIIAHIPPLSILPQKIIIPIKCKKKRNLLYIGSTHNCIIFHIKVLYIMVRYKIIIIFNKLKFPITGN